VQTDENEADGNILGGRRGIKTPPEEIAKVKARLKEAAKHYAKWAEKEESQDQGRHGTAQPR
jgi:hypothetical protein